jgi:tRNA-dihydrouridine synthase B
MQSFINSPFQIGSLTLPNRLIQGPLAGYSCAPFRTLFLRYAPPAYCVSEMISAHDLLTKHRNTQSRYTYRAIEERILAYQISGTDPHVLAQAAAYLQYLGANLIDINCGCPKLKIRKKGAGSALLETPRQMVAIIRAVREVVHIPLTVKIRIQGGEQDIVLAREIEAAGADALIVHGRRWTDDYDISCNMQQISCIKQALDIPVIANGDIHDLPSLYQTIKMSGCDAFMISRAGTGRPWLYQELLQGVPLNVSVLEKMQCFIEHLRGLAALENEHKALLQGRSLFRYYLNSIPPFFTLAPLGGGLG